MSASRALIIAFVPIIMHCKPLRAENAWVAIATSVVAPDDSSPGVANYGWGDGITKKDAENAAMTWCNEDRKIRHNCHVKDSANQGCIYATFDDTAYYIISSWSIEELKRVCADNGLSCNKEIRSHCAEEIHKHTIVTARTVARLIAELGTPVKQNRWLPAEDKGGSASIPNKQVLSLCPAHGHDCYIFMDGTKYKGSCTGAEIASTERKMGIMTPMLGFYGLVYITSANDTITYRFASCSADNKKPYYEGILCMKTYSINDKMSFDPEVCGYMVEDRAYRQSVEEIDAGP